MALQGLNKVLSLALTASLIGCASEKEDFSNKTVDQIYGEAQSLLRRGSYGDAAERFKDVDSYFPYTEKASVAQVMAAYCFFKDGSCLDAIRNIDVFLRYHPAHELVPYAMYLKAVSIYVNVATVGRDSQEAKNAKKAFIELLNRYPNSKYSADAMKRIVILDDIISAHELLIGKYYQKNKNALAAISRYNYIIANFPLTRSAEEACFRLIECSRAEKLNKEASDAEDLMYQMYPNSRWVKILKSRKNSPAN